MKKILLYAAALAGLFLAASCQRESLEQVANGTVTFTVTAPGDLDTRAIAEGLNVNEVHYAVYKTEDGPNALDGNDGPLAQGVVPMSNKSATLQLDLLQDQYYTILFWAQVEGAGHYNVGDLRNVSIVSNPLAANDESRAAFFQRHDFNTKVQENYEVTLVRPFAQINLGTTLESLTPTQDGQTQGYEIEVKESEMTVEGIASSFSLVTGEGTDESVEFSFTSAATPAKAGETLKVNGADYHYVGMNYLLVPILDKTVKVSYKITTDKGVVENSIENVPVKENYRTNIIGNLLTSKTDFEIIVDEEFNKPDELIGEGVVIAQNSADLLAALKQDIPHIAVELMAVETKALTYQTFDVPVSAWVENYYFGGASTKTITINANGNTINFVHENTDWNYIRCVNEDAKWIINDAVLTNSGENDGPWNRHDIRFYNEVELNNVTSDKAIALLKDAKLNDVTITEDTEAYALWITTEGQTVEIDGLDITATAAGRGIAIKDQYVDNPASVSLSVKNATFTTAKKAAVLVTSTAGATINWGEGNNIEGVAADSANPIWIDEGRSQYYHLVTVIGATAIIEGQSVLLVSSDGEMRDALNSGGYIKMSGRLLPGSAYAHNDKSIIDGQDNYIWGGTFNSINTSGGIIKNLGFWQAEKAINIVGQKSKVVLNNVKVVSNYNCNYAIHADEGNGSGLEATDCEFYSHIAYAAALGNAKFTNCTFGANKNGSTNLTAYAPTEFVGCEFKSGYPITARAACTFENCTLDGVAITAANVATLVTEGAANATVK